LALVRAIRAHNERSQTPIHLLGVDSWNSELPATRLLDHIKRRRGQVGGRAAAGLEAMQKKDFQARSAGIPDPERETMRAALDEVGALLQRESARHGGTAAWRASLHLRARCVRSSENLPAATGTAT
jgi:hypothetical protein